METSDIHSALQHTIDTLKSASVDQFRIYTNTSEIALRDIPISDLPFYQYSFASNIPDEVFIRDISEPE